MTVEAYFATLYAAGHSVVADIGGVKSTVDAAMQRCAEIVRGSEVVHLVGNGGSAAVVAHVQNDLVKAGHRRALVHQDIPLLTATANDCGYDTSAALPLQRWLTQKDMLIVVSSSGESDNLLEAAALASRTRAFVMTCSGFSPTNQLRAKGHVNFYVPSSDYGTVELTHAALLHYLTDRLAAC